MLPRIRPSSVVVLALGALFSILPWGMLWCVQDNTLHQNGRWGSGKVDCRKGVIGSVMCLTTRVALHRNQLDLSTWFGFQEVYLRQPRRISRVRLRVRLQEAAWLFLGFDRGEDAPSGVRGVRLSRNSTFPTAEIRCDRGGLFEFKRPIEFVPQAGWLEVELALSESDCSVEVDGRVIGSIGLAPAE